MYLLSKYKIAMEYDPYKGAYMDYTTILFKRDIPYTYDECKALRQWCEEYCHGDYYTPHTGNFGFLYHYAFLFEHKKDAMLFRLKWC